MKLNKTLLISALIAIIILLAMPLLPHTSFNIKQAEAAAPTPAWWLDNSNNFSQYDTYQFNNGRYHDPGTGSQIYAGYGTDSNILSTNASYDGVAAMGLPVR